MSGSSVTVASHSNVFGMGKIHKEIAMAMAAVADNEESSEEDLLRVSRGVFFRPPSPPSGGGWGFFGVKGEGDHLL